MLKIVNAPNPILSQKAKTVLKIDNNILKLIEEMKESLSKATDPVGVGLAAPQVSKALKIFITKPSDKSKVTVFINPKIIKKSMPEKQKNKESLKKLEGCLSLSNIWGEVLRYNEVYVEYLDVTGLKHHKHFNGFMSTIVQHEIDHLNGILFPKRVLEQKGTLYKSEKDEKGQDIFEPIKIWK